MASWSATAQAEAAVAVPRRQARAAPHRPISVLRSGVTWIVVFAALLAGIVALNVAVLQLNVRLEKLSRERAELRAENAALQSQRSGASAAGRIQSLARRKLGLVFPPPDTTTFLDLRH